MMRPPAFKIDPAHRLAKDLVYLGAHRFPGVDVFIDSSLGRHDGVLGTTLETLPQWKFDDELQRWCLEYDNDTRRYGVIPHHPDFIGDTSLTFGGWFKGPVQRNTLIRYFSKKWGTNEHSWAVMGSTELDTVRVGSRDQFVRNISWPEPVFGDGLPWFHICGRIEFQTRFRGYFNGQQYGELGTTQALAEDGGDIILGARSDLQNNRFFNGRMADLFVYRRALDDSEIAEWGDINNPTVSGLLVPEDDYQFVPFFPSAAGITGEIQSTASPAISSAAASVAIGGSIASTASPAVSSAAAFVGAMIPGSIASTAAPAESVAAANVKRDIVGDIQSVAAPAVSHALATSAEIISVTYELMLYSPEVAYQSISYHVIPAHSEIKYGF